MLDEGPMLAFAFDGQTNVDVLADKVLSRRNFLFLFEDVIPIGQKCKAQLHTGAYPLCDPAPA